LFDATDVAATARLVGTALADPATPIRLPAYAEVVAAMAALAAHPADQ
jgi:hypothetical protein